MPWKVLISTEPFEAEIIKSLLESENIPCILKRESVGHLYGLTLNGLGNIKVMVPDECLEEALKIIDRK